LLALLRFGECGPKVVNDCGRDVGNHQTVRYFRDLEEQARKSVARISTRQQVGENVASA
jgi:hypothetical protein